MYLDTNMLKLFTTCALVGPKCVEHIFKAMMGTGSGMPRPQRRTPPCFLQMPHHGALTCCVSTWLHADGAAAAGGGGGGRAVHCGTAHLVTHHPSFAAQTRHTGRRRPDGQVEHGHPVVHTVPLLTCSNTHTHTHQGPFNTRLFCRTCSLQSRTNTN